MATDPHTNKIRLGEFLEAEILKRVLEFQKVEPPIKTAPDLIKLLFPIKMIANPDPSPAWEALLLLEFETLELLDRDHLPPAFQRQFSFEAKQLLQAMLRKSLINSQLVHDFCQRILASMVELKVPSRKLKAIPITFDSVTQELAASLWPAIHSWEQKRPKQLWIVSPPSALNGAIDGFLLHCQLDIDFSPLPPAESVKDEG